MHTDAHNLLCWYLLGRAVKYTALANVKKMRELLDESIDVVGVGGVFSGEGEDQII